METLYLSCLIFGVLFALVSVVIGDLIGSFFDGALDFLSLDGHHVFQPAAAAGAVTAFGGAGLMLQRYTEIGTGGVLLLSALIAFLCSVIVFFLYIRPMRKAEATSGYSMQELGGAIAEVLTTIPAVGCGEVLVRIGAGVTNHIAESFDGTVIPQGSRVVVVVVNKDSLSVSTMEERGVM